MTRAPTSRRRGANLSPIALQGWRAGAMDPCPYLVTTTRFDAWHLGRELAAVGRSSPSLVVAVDAAHLLVDGELYAVELGAADVVKVARAAHWLA